MKVGKFGEFRLIEELARRLPKEATGLLVGIGDDAAVWQGGAMLQIATTDAMVEGVHYRPETTSWYELGWKAMASNLSDVAAMGGRPRYAVVILALRPEVEVEQVTELYRGMDEVASRFQTTIVGGDVVSSPTACVIGVTVIGEGLSANPSQLLRRSSAQVGDSLAVTGSLGASGAGLAMLLEERYYLDEAIAQVLRQAHQHPVPRVWEGRALVAHGVRAAMDISDGLVGDLEKMCVASGVGARVHTARLPVLQAVRLAFPDRWLEMALYSGEDYELLFAAPSATIEAAGRTLAQEGLAEITVIGEIVAGPVGKVLLVDKDENVRVADRGGWDHFAG